VEDLGHQAPMARIKVLDDNDRDWKVGGQRAQHLAEGGKAAGRGGQHDEVESAFEIHDVESVGLALGVHTPSPISG
jgi:hypothetical protein